MILTEYTVTTDKLNHDCSLVMLSDFHDREQAGKDAIALTKDLNPDAVIVAGDLVDRHRKSCNLALSFLSECVQIAPTYFSYGNHEVKFPALSEDDFKGTGACVLNNDYTEFETKNGDRIIIGGHKSAADFDWLPRFESESPECFKILICHHPEYYPKHLKNVQTDLILSGHAHGGQIRIFGHGILSPGQGLFPKYSKGFIDNKLIVGTGIANTGGIIPRLGNPPEVVLIKIKKRNADE